MSENERLTEYITAHPNYRRLFDETIQSWKEAGLYEQTQYFNLIQGKQHLHNKILIGESKSPKRNKYRSMLVFTLVFVFLISIVAGLIWFPANTKTVLTTEYGERKQFSLPDGSEIWLNAGSELSFDQDFNQKNRKVYLVGEAFFDVEKNQDLPFIISSFALTTQVVGTQFNVQAYENQEKQIVSVIEGQVAVSADEKEALLKSGEQVAYYSVNNQLEKITHENIAESIAWRDGLLVFNNITFGQAVKQLQRKFNVKIDFENQSIADCFIKAKFEEESLPTIMNMLCASISCDYKIIKDNIKISGTGCN